MREKKVNLSRSCCFTYITWENFPPSLELEYTEHATSHGSSDSETSIEIDREKAVEIVELLKEAYGI